MRSIINKLAIIIITFSFVTAAAIAANDYDPDKGTVAVNVADGSGNAISGNWYLHQSGIGGLVIRNGSSSEVFQIAPGNYFMELRTAGNYKVNTLKSSNPQSVSAGQSITFEITYYLTQEDKDAAASQPLVQIVEPVVEPIVEPVIEEVAEEAVESVTEEDVPSTVTLIIPNETTPGVPTFETAPSAVSADESYELGAVTNLVQTGPMAAILLIPSSVAGLWFATRRRNK